MSDWFGRIESSDIYDTIVSAANGFVYVGGTSRESDEIDYYNQPNGIVLGLTGVGNVDRYGYLAKYTKNGTILWSSRITADSKDLSIESISNQNNIVYISGYTNPETLSQINIYDSPTGSGNVGLTGPSLNDGFLIKYDSLGKAKWLARMNIIENDGYYIGGISDTNISSTSNYVYLSATAIGDLTDNKPFDIYVYDGINSTILGLTGPAKSNGNVSVVQFDSLGNSNWMGRVSGNRTIFGNFAGVNASGICSNDECVYVLTSTNCAEVEIYNQPNGSNLGFTGPGSDNEKSCLILIKYDTNGNALWSARIKSSDEAIDRNPNGITLTPDGGVAFIANINSGSMIELYDASNGSVLGLTGPADPTSAEAFVVKYDKFGNSEWVARIGGINYENDTSISSNSSGIYVSGVTFGTPSDPVVVYNQPNGSTIGLTGPSSGNDTFIIKFDLSGNSKWYSRITNAEGYSISVNGPDIYVSGLNNASPEIQSYPPPDGLIPGVTGTGSGNTSGFILHLNDYPPIPPPTPSRKVRTICQDSDIYLLPYETFSNCDKYILNYQKTLFLYSRVYYKK
jgi:hypothetical protein